MNLAGEAAGPDPCGDTFIRTTTRSGSGRFNGVSITALTTEKIAVLTPMPEHQRCHGGERKGGRLGEHPEGMLEVLEHGFDHDALDAASADFAVFP